MIKESDKYSESTAQLDPKFFRMQLPTASVCLSVYYANNKTASYRMFRVWGSTAMSIHNINLCARFFLRHSTTTTIRTATKTITATAKMTAIERDAADILRNSALLSPLRSQLMLTSIEVELVYSWWAQSMSFSSEP